MAESTEPPKASSGLDPWLLARVKDLDRALRGSPLDNPRNRWRLHQWEAELEDRIRIAEERSRRGPSPVICPSCGLIAGAGKTSCPHCGKALSGPAAWVGKARRSLRQGGGAQGPGASQVLLMMMVTLFVGGLVLGLAGAGGSEPRLGSSDLLNVVGMFIPQRVLAGEYWRLITPLFLHGGFMHILFNGMALSYIGPQIEGLYGGPRFVFLFLFSGLTGHVGTTLWAGIFHGGRVASLGASGAIFGLIGALYIAARIYGGPGASVAQDLAKRWILFALVFGLIMPGIDNGAHVGGLIGGGLGALLMGDPWSKGARVQLFAALGYVSEVIIAAGLIWGGYTVVAWAG